MGKISLRSILLSAQRGLPGAIRISFFRELPFDQPQGFAHIAVIGHNHGTIIFIFPGIIEHMNRKIDI